MSDGAHKVLVKKQDLTTKGALPSSQELYDMMHVTSCSTAIKMWKDEWTMCPVCCQIANREGAIVHKERSEILV